jgi:hypothetical protein
MDKCIYCNVTNNLTDEHIIPLSLGGKLILEKSSCVGCMQLTSKNEDALLRGHWLGIRTQLKMGSRHKKRNLEQPKLNPVKIVRGSGIKVDAHIRSEDSPFLLLPILFQPEILHGSVGGGLKPYAKNFAFATLKKRSPKVYIGEHEYKLTGTEKIEYSITKFDSDNIFRFLAKIAHSYTIYTFGYNACKKYYLQKMVQGDLTEAMIYIGNAEEEIQNTRLDKTDSFHSLKIEIDKGYVCVLIQLFNVSDLSPTPIYKVIVGESNDT